MQEESRRNEVPEDYLCTISSQVIFDPVIVVESGHSYEREAILEWFQSNTTDPQSRTPLVSKLIVDNHVLKRIISQYLSANPHCYQQDVVYIPKTLKEELLRSIEASDIRSYKNCLFKHPGLLYASIDSKGQTLAELLITKNHSDMLELFLLKLVSAGEKPFVQFLSNHKEQFPQFCKTLAMSKDQSAAKGLELILLHLTREEINKQDDSGLCLIHYAANSGNLAQLKLLISHGADPLSVDTYDEGRGLNPFMIACANGYLDIVSYYLSLAEKPNLSATTTYGGELIQKVLDLYYFSFGCTAAQLAAFHGHKAILELLIHEDSGVLSQLRKYEEEDGEVLALLDFAIIGQKSDIVTWLLSLKALTDNPKFEKQKIFTRAIRRCNKDIIISLWDHGFGPSEVNSMIHDALNFVSYDIDGPARGQEKSHKVLNFQNIYPLLIRFGADLDFRRDGEHVIHIAARSGLIEIVLFLLRAGVKVDVEDDDGKTLLEIAIQKDNYDLFNQLLQYSVDLHRTDKEGNSLLHLAKSVQVIDCLLSRGLDINRLNGNQETPLLYMLKHRGLFGNDLEIARLLIERNANLSISDEAGKSAIFYVITADYYDIVGWDRITCFKAMLEKHVDLTVTDKDENLPIHSKNASVIEPIIEHLRQLSWSREQIAEYLNTQNNLGNTVLMLICQSLWLDSFSLAAKFLLDNGANPKLVNKKGKQAIHFLFEGLGWGDSAKQKLEFADRLLKEGVDVNTAINGDGLQPLHIVAASRSAEGVKWLLERNANKYALSERKCGAKDLPAEYALCGNWTEGLDLFFSSGYDVNYQNRVTLLTLLHWAANENYKDEILSFLLNHKASLELEDRWGFTPLLRAANKGSLSAFQYLLKAGASIVKTTSTKQNIFHLIAEEGHFSLLELLKSTDVISLVDVRDASGLNPLCYAAKKKNLPVLKSLVTDFKASFSLAQDQDSPLKFALDSGDDEICNYLLDQKSLIESISKDLVELLFHAIQSSASDAVCERIACLGVDLNAKDEDEEQNLLIASAKNERFNFMRFLINKGVELNQTYEQKIYQVIRKITRRRVQHEKNWKATVWVTALYELIKDLEEDVTPDSELYKTLEQLVRLGATLTISNSVEVKCNIFTIIVERNFITLVKLFLDLGIDVRSIDKEWSLLQYPAASGNLELAKLLVKNGASITSENESNPIVLAVAAGDSELVEFLVSKFPTCVSLLGKSKPESTKNHLELVEEKVNKRDEIDIIRHSKISALHSAILHNRLNFIQKLIQSGIPVDIVSANLTPLQLAVILNSHTALDAILQYKPNLFVLRDSSKTLLELMLEYSDVSMLKRFKHSVLKQWLEVPNASGEKPIEWAIRENKEDIIEFLIVELGTNVNSQGKDNKTPLHHAVLLDRLNLVDILLKNGADVRILDASNRCPLHVAKSEPIVKVLFEHSNANQCINFQDKDGNTPLHFCRSVEVADYLISKNADLTIENNLGENCLFTVITDKSITQRLQIADRMVRHEMVNACNKSGKATLQIACENNDLEAIKWLSNNGCDFDLQNRGGASLIIAAAAGFDDIIQFLIQRGVNINFQSHDLFTPLIAATYKGNVNAVRLLLNHGADWHKTHTTGKNAFDYAIFFSHQEIFKLFQDFGVDVDSRDVKGRTILHKIAEYDSPAMLDCFTPEHFSRLNVPDDEGNTPLHIALQANREKISERFLIEGSTVTSLNLKGESILHASVKGRVSNLLLDKVLKSGVAINTEDTNGNTALMHCAMNKDFDRLKYLIDKSCALITNNGFRNVLSLLCEQVDENTLDDSGLYSAIAFLLPFAKEVGMDCNECFRTVVAKSSIVVTQLFERSGMEVPQVDSKKSLIISSDHNRENPTIIINLTMLAYLIQQGANVKHLDSPLGFFIDAYLLHYPAFDNICMLIESGADLNQLRDESRVNTTILHELCHAGVALKGRIEIKEDRVYALVQLLLDKGATIDLLDESRNSCLHLAAESNFTKIVILLLDRGANPRLRNHAGHTPIKAARIAHHDPNYIYAYLHAMELKQKIQLDELKAKNEALEAEVAELQKQNNTLKVCFATHRSSIEKELVEIREQKGYEPRFSANISTINPPPKEDSAEQLYREYK